MRIYGILLGTVVPAVYATYGDGNVGAEVCKCVYPPSLPPSPSSSGQNPLIKILSL